MPMLLMTGYYTSRPNVRLFVGRPRRHAGAYLAPRLSLTAGRQVVDADLRRHGGWHRPWVNLLGAWYYTAAAKAGDLVGNLLYKPVDLDKLVAEIERLLAP